MRSKEQRREYYLKNKEKWALYHENRKKKDSFMEKSREACKRNYYRNKEKYRVYAASKWLNRKEELQKRFKDWSEKNKDKRKAYSREYYKNRMENDENYKIKTLLRKRLLNALRGDKKVGSFVSDLGCSIDFFKEYISKKFSEGMTWENHGQWHLDHIKPLASFNMLDRNEFLKACHYTNYQPLWAKDNMKKGAK